MDSVHGQDPPCCLQAFFWWLVCIRNTVLAGHLYGKEKERLLKFYTIQKKNIFGKIETNRGAGSIPFVLLLRTREK